MSINLLSTKGSDIMTRDGKFTSWRKSSLSDWDSNCVEVSFAADGSVGVRDSKQGDAGPVLEFTASEWVAFVGGIRGGELSQP